MAMKKLIWQYCTLLSSPDHPSLQRERLELGARLLLLHDAAPTRRRRRAAERGAVTALHVRRCRRCGRGRGNR